MAGKIAGKVVSVDADGNALTDISAAALAGAPTDERLTIECEGHRTCCLFPFEHGQPEMTFLGRMTPDERLELMLTGDSAALFLGIRPGAVVKVKWE